MCVPAIRHHVKNNKPPHFIGWKKEGEGSDNISFPPFSYIFKYFAGHLDLISDLSDREALKIHFQTVPACGQYKRYDPAYGKDLTFETIKVEVCDITSQQRLWDYLIPGMCPLTSVFFPW